MDAAGINFVAALSEKRLPIAVRQETETDHEKAPAFQRGLGRKSPRKRQCSTLRQICR